MKYFVVVLTAAILASSSALAVGTVATTSAGPAFVTDRGMTLYMLSSDRAHLSTCYAKCTRIWPPYRAGSYTSGQRGWSIVLRRDGTRMWAYKGHPLYTYFKDRRPGEAYGQGISDRWGSWHIASPRGYGGKPTASYTPRYKSGRAYRHSGNSYGGMGGSSGGSGY
jgi:predicted lipoprotein with Yx(FWY)xxD motif